MFIGRETELKFLENYYGKADSQMVVVYGPRGVGKTSLIERFCENKPSTYYAARACSAREQCYQWSCELQEQGITVSKYPAYEELFANVVSDEIQGKRVVVIDEFHHLVKSDVTFIQEVIRFLNSRTQSNPVMFVLCTSASGWVENSMINRMGSAALSIGGLLKVRQMKFGEIRKAFPGYTGEDYIQIYAILGGIPGLWKSFSSNYSARENIVRNILAKESRLYEEISVIMTEELRETAVYNTILATMSRGLHKLNDIYKHTDFSRAKISVYLKNLMEIELVEKVYSFETEEEGDTQKGIYRISNPFVEFYFRFLYPHMSKLEKMSPEQFYELIIEAVLPSFAEDAYRKICRESLSGIYPNVGEWLGKSGSLDIVASDREGNLAVACCSYSRKLKYEDYEWLLFCMKKAGISHAWITMFSERGFDEELRQLSIDGKVELRHIL